MKKSMIPIAVVLVIAVGAAAYFLGSHKAANNSATSTQTTKQTAAPVKEVDLSAAMVKVKAKFPTATLTEVFTEQNDPNNMLGKPGQYVAGAAFIDSRTNTTSDQTWGAGGGGGIEVFASESDAAKRASYFSQLQQSGGGPMTDPGAFKQVGKYVVRASSQLAKSQQDEIIAYLQTLVQ